MFRPSSKAVAGVFLIAGITTLAAIAQDKKGPREFPRPKNLTVLPKNIPHDSLIGLMKEYNVSLGVSCNFCHAQSADGKHLDFASDDVGKKKIARYMIAMTAGINKQYFAEENSGEGKHTALMVSCYTCHHGHEEPEPFVMPKEEERH